MAIINNFGLSTILDWSSNIVNIFIKLSAYIINQICQKKVGLPFLYTFCRFLTLKNYFKNDKFTISDNIIDT